MKLNRKIARLLLALSTALLSTTIARGQEPRDCTEPGIYQALEITDGVLAGPGANALLDSCRSSHFILFGEAHGVAGIAELVAATDQSLSHESFHHLVIEAGDWFAGQLARGEVDEVLNRFPYSLAFDYNGDLTLINQVKNSGKNQAATIIGLDQEACAIHAFEFLAEHGHSYSARQLSKCLLLKSLFQSGKYIRTDYQRDLDVLRARLGDDPASSEIVNSISESMKIFVDHIAGRIQESVTQRETRMMVCFDQAVQKLPSDSRFIFKMGGAHTVRGIGPNGVKTLGQHVAEHADRVGQQSLHINIFPWRDDGVIPLPNEYRKQSYVLVDSRKLLSSLEAENESVEQALERSLENSDWIILMPNSESAKKSIIQEKQKSYVRSRLVKVGLVLVPTLLLLPLYLSSLWGCIGWIRGGAKEGRLLSTLPVWISLLLIGLVAFQVLLMLRAPGLASPTSYWVVVTLDVFHVLAIAAVVGAGLVLHRRSGQTWMGQTIYWSGSLGCLGLVLFIHTWGIGNLMGI